MIIPHLRKYDILRFMNNTELIDLDKLADEELLALRFCDLGLKIHGTPIEEGIHQLYDELEGKGIKFRPESYLADEWLCPDGEPIIGIAFFLAHPRLRKLEQKMMLEVEGGDKNSLMKLLRHEAGHTINYAYFLYKRKKWKKLFGSFYKEYPEKYKYRPYSKNFVRHLEEWYAQYHPDEDFAETFAVWLNPESDWREKYKGWKALGKLKYIDELMLEISEKPPQKPNGGKYWVASRMKTTLKRHYELRRKLYAEDYCDFHDFFLNTVFAKSGEVPGAESGTDAYKLIARHNNELLSNVSLSTGEKKFRINRLLKNLTKRCKDLKLKYQIDENKIMLQISVYVTAQIMNYLYTGRYKKEKDEKSKNTCSV
ncbi:MAG: putative zinc-binding metallopeptidase [Candidatus Omnitrophota bacterium]